MTTWRAVSAVVDGGTVLVYGLDQDGQLWEWSSASGQWRQLEGPPEATPSLPPGAGSMRTEYLFSLARPMSAREAYYCVIYGHAHCASPEKLLLLRNRASRDKAMFVFKEDV